MKRVHAMPFGAQALASGGVRFRLWAPSQAAITLELRRADDPDAVEALRPMQRDAEGWHEVELSEAGPGTLYRYRLADGRSVADPASRSNPFGVRGPSEVQNPAAYRWRDEAWAGRPWHTAVLYQLHVGTFTPEGTFAAAAARFGQLRALGVSAIQLMPLASFAGARGWGYDGVLPFAPHPAYGRPDDLKRLVDTAHGLGLMVLGDVVYNHFGPDGNDLPFHCPEFFDPDHLTPWGPAIAFDGPASATVRRFFVENALYWVDEFHFDGLRLDAVHAIRDGSPTHIVEEIAAALRSGPGSARHVHLVLENDANSASRLARDAQGTPLQATAQWNDDLHHAAHVLATNETAGYYAGFAEAPALLGRALAEGFAYQGEPSAAHGGRPRGEPSAALPPQAFVGFLQSHDQIGNRAFGERLDALAPAARVEALLACLLLAPAVPMLFMGEEFAASTPFLYFCDFHGELGHAVAEGRRREFGAFPAFRDAAARAAIPDPNDPASFAASTLRWDERDHAHGRQRVALVTRLLAARREQLVPLLGGRNRGGTWRHGERWFEVEWRLDDEIRWRMRANFGEAPVAFDSRLSERVIHRTGATAAAGRVLLGPDAVEVAVLRAAAPDEPPA